MMLVKTLHYNNAYFLWSRQPFSFLLLVLGLKDKLSIRT